VISLPIGSIRRANRYSWLIAAGALLAAIALGYRASPKWLLVLWAGFGVVVLARRPVMGFSGMVVTSLIVPIQISTGTEVTLNAVTLLAPAIFVLWMLMMVQRRQIFLVKTPVNPPLLLFIVSGLISLLVGLVLWDPVVPRPSNFLMVQLAQWALYAMSAIALLLTANLIKRIEDLSRLTYFFLLFAGSFAIIRHVPLINTLINSATTITFIRAPFWTLLGGLACGQLLFNRKLSTRWKIFLLTVLTVTLYYAFVVQRFAASNWVGITVTISVLAWLRWSRIRIPVLVIIVALLLSGFFYPTIYSFAGGDAEWYRSGGSRIALITRVLEDTFSHNSILGLGPAAYRLYGAMRPLQYERVVWQLPRISSHNNYVDIFAQMGLVGLGLFVWLTLVVARIGLRLRKEMLTGFESGFVNGMLAVGAGSLALMLLADWILPFVYNIGFPGLQASLLFWMFLGGLIVLDNLRLKRETKVIALQSE